MTTKSMEGKELYSTTKVFMPVPQQMGRGSVMGRGPYEKSGLIEDTSLVPGHTVQNHYDVLLPAEWAGGEGPEKVVVEAKLWYLPFGSRQSDPFLWREFRQEVPVVRRK